MPYNSLQHTVIAQIKPLYLSKNQESSTHQIKSQHCLNLSLTAAFHMVKGSLLLEHFFSYLSLLPTTLANPTHLICLPTAFCLTVKSARMLFSSPATLSAKGISFIVMPDMRAVCRWFPCWYMQSWALYYGFSFPRVWHGRPLRIIHLKYHLLKFPISSRQLIIIIPHPYITLLYYTWSYITSSN